MKKKAKVKAAGRASRPEKAGSKKAKLIKMLEGDGATPSAKNSAGSSIPREP